MTIGLGLKEEEANQGQPAGLSRGRCVAGVAGRRTW